MRSRVRSILEEEIRLISMHEVAEGRRGGFISEERHDSEFSRLCITRPAASSLEHVPHARAKCEILAARREVILQMNFGSTLTGRPCVVRELAVLRRAWIYHSRNSRERHRVNFGGRARLARETNRMMRIAGPTVRH